MRRKHQVPEVARIRERPEGWTGREVLLLGLACLTLGILIGYAFRGPTTAAPLAAGVAPQPGAQAPGSPLHSAEAVRPFAAPMLALLEKDPKNFDLLVSLGNLYYDNHVYPEAIEYYTRALSEKPDNTEVRTDLGTAYWYSGSAEKAIAEYERSLANLPNHPQTLFNLGIVRLQGLKDPAGAVRAWERLLAANPAYPERQRVLALIEEARSGKAGAASAAADIGSASKK